MAVGLLTVVKVEYTPNSAAARQCRVLWRMPRPGHAARQSIWRIRRAADIEKLPRRRQPLFNRVVGDVCLGPNEK